MFKDALDDLALCGVALVASFVLVRSWRWFWAKVVKRVE